MKAALREKGLQPITNKVDLMKWPGSVVVMACL